MLPVLHAFAAGKRIEHRQPDGTWLPLSYPCFADEPEDYRVKSEESNSELVAGEDLVAGEWAILKDGVVMRQGLNGLVSSDWFVESAVCAGTRVKIVPDYRGSEWRDRVVALSEPEFKHYVPRANGELNLDLMQEKGQEIADDTNLIPMIRDLGHWLVLVIRDLRWATAAPEEDDETVLKPVVQPPVYVENQDSYDPVNRPKHYVDSKSGYEALDFTEHMTGCLSNVMKYAWRQDGKGQPILDLEKCLFYMKRHRTGKKYRRQDLVLGRVLGHQSYPIGSVMCAAWNHDGAETGSWAMFDRAIRDLEAEIDRRKEAAK
jgi:hypothetical protein